MAPSETTGFPIKLISERITKNINQQLKTYGVTLTQMRVLNFMAGRPGCCATQREIEDFLHVTHPTVVGILKIMVRNDLIEYVHHTPARRTKPARLTPRSHEILDALKHSGDQFQREAFTDFSGDECSALHSLLADFTII
jgi:DNA-binding MarR family transcriptional regulator